MIATIIGVATFVTATALNFNANLRNDGLSDLSLATIEILAQGESNEEFKESTGGCSASWNNENCKGNSCAYSYATGTCTK